MPDILKEIIDTKKEEVAAEKVRQPLDVVQFLAKQAPPLRDFYAAITQKNARGLNIIAEIKKASPSAGLIRPDFDPVAIASIYQRLGADAISVLTDYSYFQGKLDYLQLVRAAVKLPLLRKDFIIDPWQVYQSRAAGADAILLIAEAFDHFDPLSELFILAGQLNLAVLFEIHELESLGFVDRLMQIPRTQQPRWLLGINNRNLKTMQVDIEHSLKVSRLYGNQVPLVSESGIKDPQQVQILIQHGFQAVLIGETLMRQPDITIAFQSLFGPTPS